MQITNRQAEIVFSTCQHLSKDFSTRSDRKLPLLPSIRIKRTINDLQNAAETIGEMRQNAQERYQEVYDESREKVLDEDQDFTEQDFVDEVNAYQEKLGESIAEFLNKTINVEFTDLVTMEDFERIDNTLEGGVPSSVAEGVLAIEELHQQIAEAEANDSDS